MTITNINEAKTHLSKLIERVSQGEEIVIGKAGKPVAKLVPYTQGTGPRKLDIWKGQVWISDDFDELPKDIADAFGMEPK